MGTLTQNGINRQVVATFSDITAARALDVEYQNTSGYVELHNIVVQLGVTLATDSAGVNFLIGTASPPATQQAEQYISGVTNALNIVTLTALVPPYYYYKAASVLGGGGGATKTRWTKVIFN